MKGDSIVKLKSLLDAFTIKSVVLNNNLFDTACLDSANPVVIGVLAEEIRGHMATLMERLKESGFSIIAVGVEYDDLHMELLDSQECIYHIKAFTKTKKGLIRKCEMYKLNFFLEDNKVLVNEGRYYIPSNASKRSYRVVYRHKALNLLSGLKSYAYRLLKLEKNTIREPLFLEMMTRVVCDGMTLVEVGSDDGFEANFIAKKFPNKSINFYIVEPDKRNINNIKKNLSKLKKVVFINKAISNINKKSGDFYLSKGRSNLNSLSRGGEADQKISVGYVTLDNLMESLNVSSPVMVKMDIEGHEFEVLRAITQLDPSQLLLPDVIFETHNRTYSPDRDISGLLAKLLAKGYTVPYVSSSSPDGTRKLEKLGSPARFAIRTDDTRRTIHEDLPIEALEKCLNPSGGIRTIFLQWNRPEYA